MAKTRERGHLHRFSLREAERGRSGSQVEGLDLESGSPKIVQGDCGACAHNTAHK